MMADRNRNRKHDGAIFRKRPKPKPITTDEGIAAELMRFVQAYEQLPAGPPDQVQAWAAEIDRLSETIAAEPPESILRDDIEALRESLIAVAGYFKAGNPKALAHAMRECALFGYRLAIIRCRIQDVERAAGEGRDLINRPAKKMTPKAIEARGVTRDDRTKEAERLYRDMRKESPNAGDKSLRIRIARAMGIEVSTLGRYLTAARAKELR